MRRKSFVRRKSFPTKKQAREWATKLEFEHSEGLTVNLNHSYTFGDAVERYVTEVSPEKKGFRWEKIRGNFLKKLPIYHIYLNELSPRHISEYRDLRLQTVLPATVKRELNFISSVLSTAMRDWEWIGRNPVEKISKPKSSIPRDRRISNSEIDLILKTLKYEEKGTVLMKKQQTAVLFLLAIETAMRTKELAALSWNQVHLNKRYVQLIKSKNGDPRKVSLSIRAIELFKKLEDLDPVQVFTMSESVASTMFYRAKTEASLHDLNLHDSRREATSRLARKLDVMDLAKMTGHRDIKILLNVYYKPEVSDIAELLD